MASSMLAKLWVELGFKDGGFQKGIKRAGAGMSQLNASGNQMATIFGGVANKAVMALTGSLTAFLAATAVVGAKFDREMQFVGAITNASAVQMGLLEDKARDLGKTTMYSATEAANAMQSFARVGMRTNQIIAASGPALKLAGAAGHDLSATTQTMSATMAQFNLEASEAGRISDVFAVAITNSLFDMNSLSEAMKYGGTVGKAFKMSLEETTAALSLFRDMGLEGSLAGTQFRMSMASAAKMTSEKVRILHKLGLTAAAISPEFNSFAQIMEALAETTIGTGDALVLFGRRAGANMAGLIEDFREGKTTFYDMLDALEQSTGMAAQLYDRATNNVLDQFTIAKSAFQELMLTVFDAYKDPMMDLLKAIAETLNYTATGIHETGGAMKSGFTDALDYMTAYFVGQKEQVADGFRNLLEMAAQFLGYLVRLGPYLSIIMKTFIVMWVVGKVVAFTSAVYGVLTAMMALKLMAASTGAAMALAFAPLAAIVVTAAALGGAIYYFAGSSNEAAASTERLAEGLRKAKAAQKLLNSATSIAIGKAGQASIEWARNTEILLIQAGMLDAVRKRELRKLQELDEQAKKSMVARGAYIMVMEEEGEVLKSVRMIIHDQIMEMEGWEKGSDQLAGALDESEGKVEALEKVILALTKNYNRWRKATKDTTTDQSILIGILEDEYGSIEELQGRIHTLAPALGLLEKGYNGLTAAIKAALHAEERLAKTPVGGEAAKILKKEENVRKGGTSRRKQAAQERIKLIKKLTAAEFKAMNTEFAYRKMMLDAELAEVSAAFQKEIKLNRKHRSKRKALREQEVEALKMVEAKSASLELESQRAALEKMEMVRKGFLEGEEDSALAAITAKYDNLLVEENKRLKEGLVLLGSNLKAKALLESQHELVVGEIAATAQAAQDNLSAQRAKDTAKAIHQIRVDNASVTARTITEVEQELEQALLDQRFAGEKQRSEIQRLFAERRIQAIRDLEARILGLLGGFTNRRILLERERDALLLELTEETEKYRAAIILRYMLLIRQARRGEREEAKADLESQGDWIDRFWDRAVVGLIMYRAEVAVVGHGIKVSPEMEAFKDWWAIFSMGVKDDWAGTVEDIETRYPKLSKFAASVGKAFGAMGKWANTAGQNIKGKIGEGLDHVKDRTTVVGKAFHAAGVVAKGIGLALGATKSVFKMMLAGALKFAKGAVAAGKMVAAGVGQITAAWGKTLDALSTYLGFSFSITDGMERANELMDERADTEQSIADLDKDIAAAVASGDAARVAELQAERDELNAALDKLPETHKAAAEAYAAEMVTGAIDTLNKMVESAPAMILAMAEEAPRLINALVQQLPALIEGLAQAIPQLMQTIAEGIPRVMEVLAETLPDLFEAIFAMLPTLVTALMDALIVLIPMVGEIISMFIMALPEIFTAFFEKLPEIITALIGAISDIVRALVTAIPLIIEGFIENLGPLLQSLIEGAITIVLLLLRQIPKLVRSLIKQIPVLVESILIQLPYMISAVISALPNIIRSVIQLIPKIIFALIDMIPQLIVAVVQNIGPIIKMIVYNIPYIAKVLVYELVIGLLLKIGLLVGKALYKFYRFFADMMIELWGFIAHPFKPKKRPKTETFGDTPGVQYADESQDVVFGAGDYFAAAKSPLDLLMQSLEGVLNTGAISSAQLGLAGAAASPGVTGGSLMLPNMQPVVQGILEATDAIRGAPGTAGGAGGGGQDIRVVVKAEGSVLDDVLYRATKRGHAPKLIDMMKKVSGVDVGMWRGGFADES